MSLVGDQKDQTLASTNRQTQDKQIMLIVEDNTFI